MFSRTMSGLIDSGEIDMQRAFQINKDAREIHKMIKRKKQTQSEIKLPEGIIWLDDCDEITYKLKPEYAAEWEHMFDATPHVYLEFTKTKIKESKSKEYHDFLEKEGFIPRTQNGRGYKCFVDMERKMIIQSTEEENWLNDDKPVRSSTLSFYFYNLESNKEFVENFIELLDGWVEIEKNDKNSFYMIAQGQQGLYNQKTEFNAIPIKDDRYDLYYGESFPHEKIKKFVGSEKTDSLLLLWGDPGSGKSNYMKNLIINCERNVIYIPPSMVSVISEPSFVGYMMENRGSILIIEDAEQILSADRNSATNNLLGLCDGFLKDSMDLKIIASFNCDIGKIDPALLRKGRLYYEHKFDKLSCTEAQKLAKFCGINATIEHDMTLADIFNIEHETSAEDNFKERSIGFL